jgi:chemotaxis protein CheD
MGLIVVGVADCRVSDNPNSVLATYALGSCVAVAIHDPVAGVGGMLHFMLPESSINRSKAQSYPFMFADTGIPMLFRSSFEHGAEMRRLVVQVAGGAQMMQEHGALDIGKRNYLAVRKILRKAGLLIHSEVVGGTLFRAVRLEIGSGKVWIREAGSDEREMPVSGSRKRSEECPSACLRFEEEL